MKKNSPRTLFVVGIAGVVTSTFLACRATLKLDKTLDDFNKDIDEARDRRGNKDDQTYRQELVYAYTKGTYSIARLYAPAILIGTASIGALTGSHVVLTRRNSSLTAAYSAVQMSFDAYRERVRKEIGDEKELDIHHAITLEKVPIDGKLQEIRKADPNKWSPYARFFDEGSANWQKSPEFNRLFVQCQQNYSNDLLHARGHVFLNEVYDMLGINRSQAGQVVGWVLDQGGDNYIDFGIFEAYSAAFVNGWERSILLDFNVDGIIYDKI
jgi:hypothetical protein